MTVSLKQAPAQENKIEQWFEDLIVNLKSDFLQISSGIASPEKTRLYNTLMQNSAIELAKLSREQSARVLISSIVSDYLHEIESFGKKPIELALKLSVSEILVWAVIDDNDEDMEDNLLLAEAKTNSTFYDLGFHINTTIVENGDKIRTPSHYQSVYN